MARYVVATPDLYRQIDALLPAERTGPVPSRHDFLAYVLPVIMGRFASDWDALPERFAGRATYREVITVGVLVPYVAVLGQMTGSGVVELVEIEIDLEGLPDPGDD